MNLKNEFEQFLLVKGIKTEDSGFDYLSFMYKDQHFELHLVSPFLWEESQLDYAYIGGNMKKLRSIIKLSVYNEGHLYSNNKKVQQIVADINERYRGLKAYCLSHYKDYMTEISVELFIGLTDKLKEHFFEYLDHLVKANMEVTKDFDSVFSENDFNPFD